MDLILGTMIGIFLTLITLSLLDYFKSKGTEEDKDWWDY